MAVTDRTRWGWRWRRPYIDELLSGHDLAGLERFVERLPALG